MKKCLTGLCVLALTLGAHADTVQLITGKALTGRVAGYANDSFELEATNAPPIKIPANSVATIDFSKGAVRATVELAGGTPLAGKIWLYARGALNFDSDQGDSTRIQLSQISRVSFSDQPIPERPAPPPVPKPARAWTDPYASPAAAKIETISRGEEVDIQKHCVQGKITVVDFYADWCGPCRAAGPVVEDRVNKDNDLVLRKINIVNWTSPVSKQFGLHGIPYFQVYDRRGNKVGDMTGFNQNTLESYLTQARNR